MSVSYSVYVGRYIKVKNWYNITTQKETIHICSNENCWNNKAHKNLGSSKFCPECGSKVIPDEVDVKKQGRIDLYDICKEVFNNDSKFCEVNDCYVIYNKRSVFSESFSSDDEVSLIDMVEYMKNKTEDDDVDILSKHLTKLEFENEIKFGVVGYYC